ncbi:transcription factor bHLH112-like [Typha angustifolia]|uniref:transcription factor bHLH112-like n=1 Tax=Typha angustifolia TaxID=59011 RepID=UPI003C2CE667
MADDFQTGICTNGGNWWNPGRTAAGFDGPTAVSCSMPIADISSGGAYGWSTAGEMVEAKSRSCDESAGSASGSSVTFQDSTLQLPSHGLSSTPPMYWTQSLLRSSGKAENSFNSMLQEDLSTRSYFRHEAAPIESDQIHVGGGGGGEESGINSFKDMNQNFILDQHHLNSGGDEPPQPDCGVTNYHLSPVVSYGCPSTMLQSLFEPDTRPQQSIYQAQMPEFRGSPGEIFQPSWAKFPQLLKSSPFKQQLGQGHDQMQFTNNTPFWNASGGATNELKSGFYPLSPPQIVSQTFAAKPGCSNLIVKSNTEGDHDKQSSSEPAYKKTRIETPSPLPTFKVRKEKLGDRITALQQLVAPFGKTDTASVLHEAIGYIKFLHDQVGVLSTPYLKNGHPMQHQQGSEKSKDGGEGSRQDLRSRGLCLVPIASTYPVASETTADFWHPTFGGTFR